MSLDDWNEYTGKSWLKAEEVTGQDQAFVVVAVDISEEDNRPQLTLQNNGNTSLFQLNVTNANKCKEFVDSPKAMIGKKVFFKKVTVMSPSTKKEVESLRVLKVE